MVGQDFVARYFKICLSVVVVVDRVLDFTKGEYSYVLKSLSNEVY